MSLPGKNKEKEKILDSQLDNLLNFSGEESYVDLTVTFTSNEWRLANPKNPFIQGIPIIRLLLSID